MGCQLIIDRHSCESEPHSLGHEDHLLLGKLWQLLLLQEGSQIRGILEFDEDGALGERQYSCISSPHQSTHLESALLVSRLEDSLLVLGILTLLVLVILVLGILPSHSDSVDRSKLLDVRLDLV